MSQDFNYKLVPYGYAHCMNHNCDRAKQCLRQTAATHIEESYPTISVINPTHIPADTSACPFFRSNQKIRVAWGIKDAFNTIPHKDALAIKYKIKELFGKTLYYRIYRKEYYITPKQQEQIRSIFHSLGVDSEPTYESYEELYNW